jgi:undecaprenyl-diphosphatase
MDLLQVILLGALQGITEWLPISSSGHLVLLQEMWGVSGDRTLLTAVLHLGTLVAVVLYFRRDIWNVITSALRGDRKEALHIVVGSVPICVVGFLLKDYIESAFSTLILVGALWIINGIYLLTYPRRGEGGRDVSLKSAVFIGLAQVAALLPGISRSGVTITTGAHIGVERVRAAKFSFYISLIPLAGATLFKAGSDAGAFEPIYLVGFVVSLIVGYLSISLLMYTVRKVRFQYFGIYTIALGLLTVAYTLLS